MSKRGRVKIGLVGLLPAICLLLLLGGLSLLPVSTGSASTGIQRNSANMIVAQETETVTPTGTVETSPLDTPSPAATSPLDTPTPSPTPTETNTPSPTPTPVVTIAPTPTPVSAPALLSFDSSSESIIVGEEVVLRWDVVNAAAITLSYDSVLEILPIETTTFAHSPLITTVYTLTASSGGGTLSRQLTVGVDPKVEPTAVPADSSSDSPLDPPLESPLDPPLESPLDKPTETPPDEPTATEPPPPTESPTPTLTPLPTNTAAPTNTATPTATPTPTSTPTNTLIPTLIPLSTTKPIGLTLTPLAFEKSVTGDDSGNLGMDRLGFGDGNNVDAGRATSTRLRYIWYYIVVSLCILLPLLLLSLLLLFWWLGDRRVRYAHDDDLLEDLLDDGRN